MSTGGGDKPAEVKASKGEKEQAKLAREQINYYRGTFAPLEQQFATLADQDPSARLVGQNGSASAREMTNTLRQAALGNAPVDTAGIAEGKTLGRVGAMAQGTRELADNRLDALGVGLGITADSSRSLSTAASAQTDSAIRQTQLSLAKQQAKNDERAALMGAVGSLGGMYAGYKLPGMMASKGATLGSTQAGYTGADFNNWVAGQRK